MPNKRKSLTVSEKVEIIRELESGAKNIEICKKFSLSASSVSSLWKNRNVYLSASDKNVSQSKKLRKCKLSNVDEALLEWFHIQKSAGCPINGPILKAQAEKFAIQFGQEDFVCNNGWLDRFKNRHNIVYAKIVHQSQSVDPVIYGAWLSSVWPQLTMDYSDEDIFNADEAGIFYNITPDNTFNVKGRKSKSRLTVLVCANMSGSEKRKLFVIGKSTKPRCFINVNQLPVDYTANKKAWMTCDIFRKYLNDWNEELIKKDRKILLLLDECPAHPKADNLSNIKLVFLPSFLQPMDIGIINSLKSFYKKFIVLHLIKQRDRKLKEFISVLDAINLLSDAWNQVTPNTILHSFIKAKLSNQAPMDGFDCEEDDSFPFSEWLVRNKIVDNKEVDDFVRVEDELFTCELPTEGDIVDAILSKEEEESDAENSQEHFKPVPGIAQADDAIDVLMTFFQNYCDTNSDTFNALSVLRGSLRDAQVKSLRESSILKSVKIENS